MAKATNLRANETHKLPTNTTTSRHAIHRWANITAGFSPEFVYGCIERDGLLPGSVVLDPFTGMATTQVAANHLGVDAIGYEPQPHFWTMAVAKVSTRDVSAPFRIRKLLEDISPVEDIREIWNETQIEYLSKLVPAEQLKLLAGCLVREGEVSLEDKPIFRLVVSKLLEWASGSSTDGIYKAPSTQKRSHDVRERIPVILEMIESDLRELPKDAGKSVIHPRSSIRMPEIESNSVDLIVTSPPYMNNFDFAEMARMELYFWREAEDWGEITEKVRSKLVVNTTTVPSRFKRDQDQWVPSIPFTIRDEVDSLVLQLRDVRQQKAGKKDYEKLIKPYFSQMAEILAECYRVLRDEAKLDLVVADAALYGIHIPTEQLLADTMKFHGFQNVEVTRLRNRGTRWVLAKRDGSPVGLGEFHVTAQKGK